MYVSQLGDEMWTGRGLEGEFELNSALACFIVCLARGGTSGLQPVLLPKGTAWGPKYDGPVHTIIMRRSCMLMAWQAPQIRLPPWHNVPTLRIFHSQEFVVKHSVTHLGQIGLHQSLLGPICGPKSYRSTTLAN